MSEIVAGYTDGLPPIEERSPQDQVHSLIGFYNGVRSDWAEEVVRGGGSRSLYLQTKLVALDSLLKEHDKSQFAEGLADFSYSLQRFAPKGWNGSQFPTSFYPDEWAARFGPAPESDRETFAGTTLGGTDLASLIMYRTKDNQPVSYHYYHEMDSADTFYDDPKKAITLLRHARKYTPRGGERFAEYIGPLKAIADEMFDEAFDKARAGKNYGALAELCVGVDFMPQALAYVYDAEDTVAARDEIVRTTERVVMAAEKLSACFHPELQRRVEEAFLRVGLRFVFGLRQHQLNSYDSQDELVLGNDFRLPVRLKGNEPMELLDELFATVDEIHQAVTAQDSIVTTKMNGDGYSLFRYVTQGDTGKRSSVQEYIRSQGAYAYDPLYEYGRPTEGVEASHSFIRSKQRFLHYSKDPDDASLVSLRIDFEGLDPTKGRNANDEQRDPTSERGTLSLDVGSILGHQDVLGVRIGRFLAWCDQLRFHEQQSLHSVYSPESPSFNHGYEAFETGSRELFARLMRQVIMSREHDSRYQSLHELASMTIGAVAQQAE